MNPVAQGAVDSTIGAHVALNRTATVYYWLAAGEDYASRQADQRPGAARAGPEFFLHRARIYWNRWVNKDNIPYGDLPDPLGNAIQAVAFDIKDADRQPGGNFSRQRQRTT